jgi:pimeloyl-ACP methyl ester carboxylesterase
MKRYKAYLLMIVMGCCALLSISGVTRAAQTTADKLESLGGYPCPNSDFTCITLTVPLDHFGRNDSPTIEVVFGVLPATGERKGAFVIATGGPGYFGLSYADSYTAAFDPSITEQFDIVFFDQRGEGLSGGYQCQNAAAAFYSADSNTKTPEQEKALIAAARAFAEDCVAEAGFDTATLPHYSTVQSVEDLEAFRKVIDDDKLWLYGESYGTQYAQTYTAAHADRVAGLILDGTVDLTASGPEYYVEQVQAFNDVLVQTLAACNEDVACAADLTNDALALYDDLAAELSASSAPFDFPMPAGGKDQRQFTFTDLETVAAGQIYSEDDRMIFQRTLAAAAQGDLTLLARLAYYNLGLDPETLLPIPVTDTTYSDAMYYAIECNDYNYFEGAPEARAEAFMRAGDRVEETVPYLSSVYYGDLPCVFWPGKLPAERPVPLVAEGIPTLVLGATADPATPAVNGERVFSRLADAYLITTRGGAHVIFGRGDACPDELVTAFLVEGKTPAERQTFCEGVIASEYVSLAPADASVFENPLQALDSAYNEMYYLPEFYYWDTVTLTLVGCPYGGTLGFAPSSDGTQFRLSGCAFSDGFIMTGYGAADADSNFTLDVTVSGLQNGQLRYLQDADGNSSVSGEYGGDVIDLASGT